ncbi:arginine--tRNA ligase [Kaistia dalseonensis]|uniref:Arginine--tRNA ligase n=1 Tax=Kaistia dalseonensis TaxID=410840 RepID=A0ABU0H3U7_9HYPH|nr:arginine--tRNA ligase [Kaistia dalseonensis]MCX5493591.1 arginine--tRNA ligase [Kaistia dalseonensis]MDQ0436151.1 arginyl-tRNA synthetase [Kaistia dalseonensis]
MNIFRDFTTRVSSAVQVILAARGSEGADLSRIVVEPPRDAAHGDLSTNAAMVLAKPLGLKPRDLAEAIAGRLRDDADVASVEVAGPGFINIALAETYRAAALKGLIEAGEAYGRSTLGAGLKVNVEYVSANPTGPMHVGHCRGAVVGDALANLLDWAGFAVTKEYYINDAGGQVDVLARSAFLRYREALGEEIGAIPEGLYPGDYLKPVGVALVDVHGRTLLDMPESKWLPIVREAAISAMMLMIRDDLALLNVHHDVFFSERSLSGANGGKIASTIEDMEKKGFVYRGTLPPPKGQLPEDWEDREQLLFRATDVGDDIDRPLMKSDGSYTYFAGDVAYFKDKFDRGFRRMIYVLGADHGGYVKRLQAVGRAISGGTASVEVLLCQLVKLYRGGEPVRMSKRSGDFVTLRDVVEEVGRDAVRFMMLYRKSDAPLDFDFQKVTEQSKDNPVFYVQYGHARAASILRNAANDMPTLDLSATALANADLSLLSDQGEISLQRRLAEFPRIIEGASEAHEPHRIAFYLYELAAEFHQQWNRGKDLPQLRFINVEEPELTSARLALVHATKLVLSSGLLVLGVSAPEEMR